MGCGMVDPNVLKNCIDPENIYQLCIPEWELNVSPCCCTMCERPPSLLWKWCAWVLSQFRGENVLILFCLYQQVLPGILSEFSYEGFFWYVFKFTHSVFQNNCWWIYIQHICLFETKYYFLFSNPVSDHLHYNPILKYESLISFFSTTMRYCYFYLFLFFLLWNVVSYAQEPTYRPVRIGQRFHSDGSWMNLNGTRQNR